METIEAIKSRRSIGKMTGQKPTRDQIEQLLSAATYAPNHHLSEPWRFIVLAGEMRVELGKVMAETLASRLGDTTGEKARAALQKEAGKLLRAPVVIVVASVKPINNKVLDIENVEAVAAAVQNMLLTARELGLACIWRTGEPAYDPTIKQYLELDPEDHIVAFVYVGFPATPDTQRIPAPFEEKTRWLGWED